MKQQLCFKFYLLGINNEKWCGRLPSAEGHWEVYKHGKNPNIDEVPHKQSPGSRSYGCRILEEHILCTLLENTLDGDKQSFNVHSVSYFIKPSADWSYLDRYSPDFAPNPDRVLSIIAAKKVISPRNMSTTRAGLWFTMMMMTVGG